MKDIKYTKKYGLILGRFMPLHYGHQHIVNEVLLDGLTPLILLGDDDGANPKRNPLSFEQRKELFKLIYPNTELIILPIHDRNNWTDWFDDVGHTVIGNSGRRVEEVILYYNNKEQDRYDHFEAYGKEYTNDFYTQIFKDNDVDTKQVEFVERNDITINADATNIRKDIEAYKHLLDARIYHKLKEWKW